jgi:phage tail P2-like protein
MSNETHQAGLLPPNATALERAAARAFEAATALDVPLRELWNPDTCPVELLPWLAWAVVSENWEASWPESVKRARIKASVGIHKIRGTTAAVRRVVNSFGADLAMREWWQQSPKGEPYTFTLALKVHPNLPQSPQYLDSILRVVDEAKPARAHYTFSIARSARADVATPTAALPVTYARLDLMEAA